jgi:hypothetical protein
MGWINITTLLKMRNLKGSDFANIAVKTGLLLSNCCQNLALSRTVKQQKRHRFEMHFQPEYHFSTSGRCGQKMSQSGRLQDEW